MTWGQFTAQPNGTRIYNHGFDQCVALANQYHEDVIGGSFVPVPSAFMWWTDFSSYGTLTANYTQSATPIAGAIFVARYGLYDAPNGHIGVVTSVNGSTFQTMEQNAESNRWLWRYSRSMQNVLGFLHPKNNPATPLPPQPVRKKKKMLQFITDNPNGAWYATDGLTKRKLAPNENQLLVDLGLAVYSGKPGGVHVIGRQQLAAIPDGNPVR
jgi:surface antigen